MRLSGQAPGARAPRSSPPRRTLEPSLEGRPPWTRIARMPGQFVRTFAKDASMDPLDQRENGSEGLVELATSATRFERILGPEKMG